MKKTIELRQRALEAYEILNELIGDLVVTTNVFKDYHYPAFVPVMTSSYQAAITRLCVYHIVMSLAKFIEFYQKYKSVIPEDVRANCTALQEDIQNRGVREFRNKVVGHIWDKNTKRPLTYSDTLTYLDRIYCGNFDKFLLWVNNPYGNKYPETVVGTVQYIRDRIQQEFNISEEEVFGGHS